MKELTVEAIVEQIETVTEFVNAELEKRSEKTGNLKQFHQVDHNT